MIGAARYFVILLLTKCNHLHDYILLHYRWTCFFCIYSNCHKFNKRSAVNVTRGRKITARWSTCSYFSSMCNFASLRHCLNEFRMEHFLSKSSTNVTTFFLFLCLYTVWLKNSREPLPTFIYQSFFLNLFKIHLSN